jgi:hypothetical protein
MAFGGLQKLLWLGSRRDKMRWVQFPDCSGMTGAIPIGCPT